jgi:hypothetical protein
VVAAAKEDEDEEEEEEEEEEAAQASQRARHARAREAAAAAWAAVDEWTRAKAEAASRAEAERARAEDLERARAEAAAKTLLAAAPLPPSARLPAWRALYGVPASLDEGEESRFISAVAASVAIPNARVVLRDAPRTRAELPAFRAAGVEARVATLCTYYAAGGYVARTAAELAATLSSLPPAVQYRQGLNEVVAAVLLAAPGAAGTLNASGAEVNAVSPTV